MTGEKNDLDSDLTHPAENESPLIVIASNRGPFSFTANKDGSFAVKRGSGGLVTALAALAEQHDVMWFAAALSPGDRKWAEAQGERMQQVQDVTLRLIITERRRYRQYYNIISNPLLWFLQHQLWDTPRQPEIRKNTWDAWRQGYVAINRQFAEVIAESVKDVKRPIYIFPQDYQLYMMPQFLREILGERVQIQPFIHIPWPGPDAWRILPREIRDGILQSLLASNRIGFQTRKDAFNFVQTCRFYIPDAHSRGARDAIHYQGRRVEACTYPISIDVDKVEELADEAQTHLLKAQLLTTIGDRQLILRVDRVEPSKNILRGLVAFREMLAEYPQHRGKVNMLALLVPSRMEVTEYQDYLREIMAEAGMINAEYADEFWEPVRIIVGNNYHRAIAAMQLYDVLLVNPIADGMNLVAKEGTLVNQRDGVLVLSEHAGAFYELGDHALVVSPFDVQSTARGLNEALIMPRDERASRAAALRKLVRNSGVREWFRNQVADATAASSQAKNDSTPDTP
ncbi:MAG: trehalose-6-phosphate synthase [Anaerolineae bacterium]|nr:trehalose-6-phosphate synthase [Anaerolineae bacterium]